ncbi:MAG: ankyrin repeat domain-containing protein [Clostridia bacterium]|jgi:ankyrin repeat protein
MKNNEKLINKFKDLLSNPLKNNLKMYSKLNKLVKNGVPISTVNRFGKNLLTVAVQSDNEILFDYALQNSKNLTKEEFIDWQDSLKCTPLYFASQTGNLKFVKKLREVNANPNLNGLGGWSPLIKAAEIFNLEIMNELKEMGANPNQKNFLGDTAAHVAAHEASKQKNQENNEKFISVLMSLSEMGANLSALNGNEESVEDVYLKTDIQSILDSASKGNINANKMLMENLSNPTAKNLNIITENKVIDYFKDNQPKSNANGKRSPTQLEMQ